MEVCRVVHVVVEMIVFVMNSMCIGTDGYIIMGLMRNVQSLRLLCMFKFLNLFSLVRLTSAIAFRSLIWLCIPVDEKVSLSISPLLVYR